MKSLRTQLSLFILLTLLIIIGLIGFFSNWSVNREFEKYITESVQIRSHNIVGDLERQYESWEKKWNADYVHVIGMYSLYDGYILKLYDTDGRIVWDAENHDMSLCGKIMDEISARMKKLGDSGDFVTHKYNLNQNGHNVGSVSITYYGPYFLNENEFSFISTMNTVFIIIGVLASVLSILIGYLLARKISRPVTKTASIAKQIAEGNYDIKFEEETKTKELNDLVGAVNHLAKALSDQECLRKQMTADIAHELRTPLTAVSSHLEAMIEGLWEVTPERLQGCHDEIKRLGALVIDLERLAKIENENLPIYKSKIDLKDVVDTVAQNMIAEVAKKSQTLDIYSDSVFVNADKDRMHQVVHNLLSNAMKYTPEGGRIQLEVINSADYGIISVTDNGIGIPEQELPLIFERFYRADKSRNRRFGGAGIGLTIVKSIVAAHGGNVSVDNVSEGGCCFMVRIPKENLNV